ncbi:MAG: deoxyribodipyrimidine photo-lyase [Rhodobacteraceae bacterium]|nr:deoxyribodipyrimidine photo-lyase [Paracoccaceae bacterium]
MTDAPVIYWMRRDFRLADNPALCAAATGGRPVIPVFIYDPQVKALGAAPKWRLGQAIARFRNTLEGRGSRLVLRRGTALDVLKSLIAETGAQEVVWGRLYDPEARGRDTRVKAALNADGIAAVSYPGHVVFEPWTAQTRDGGFYKVYSPFWRAVKDREAGSPLPAPEHLPAPATWPISAQLNEWGLACAMGRGASVVAQHVHVGEAAAGARLRHFIAEKVGRYAAERDFLDRDACSGLSENLTYGEVSARLCWHLGAQAMQAGAAGAERFLRELIWRDFACHLLYHTPHITSRNWRGGWDAFPWATGDDSPGLLAWKQGRTGVQVIDAAMREMYVTGRMHNRARMLVASYLTKHMMVHWREGAHWFEECLIDWDPASNAMGWQWVAGSGPDAAPYFRIFNPQTQAMKFDADGRYRRRWLAELNANPGREAMAYFEAIPKDWGLSPDMPYPKAPVVGMVQGRARALHAYANRTF